MIKHVVMFKLKEFPAEEKANLLREIKTRLEDLKSNIQEIRHLEAGINITDSERAFDVALVSEFDDTDALERYRVHPKHREVVDFLSEIREKSHVVDYEC